MGIIWCIIVGTVTIIELVLGLYDIYIYSHP